MSLTVIFAGTPAFATPTLEALLRSSHKVIAVYTQPDRPAGRGRKMTESPVKTLAKQHALPLYQPATLRDAQAQEALRALQADVMVVAAYGLLLPPMVLSAPKFGCVNVHPSLLPRWRGATPIQSPILAGDQTTGVTIMQMNEGLDTGDLLRQIKTDILPGEVSGELHDRLSLVGADLLIETLDQIDAGTLIKTPQEDALATYAKKFAKTTGKIDWQLPAEVIGNVVRACNPWPVATTTFEGKTLRIWRADVLPETSDYPPGAVAAIDKHQLCVATGEGLLRLLDVQMPGGKRVSVQDFINAHKAALRVGSIAFR